MDSALHPILDWGGGSLPWILNEPFDAMAPDCLAYGQGR